MKKEKKKKKDISDVLDKYVKEDNREVMKDKYYKISDLIDRTEKEIEDTIDKKVKFAKRKMKRKEKKLVKKGNLVYTTFTSDLRSAIPQRKMN